MSKEQKKTFEELCSKLTKMSKEPAVDGKCMDDLACEWGLACNLASKMADPQRIKVITAAWVMSS